MGRLAGDARRAGGFWECVRCDLVLFLTTAGGHMLAEKFQPSFTEML